MYGTRALCNQRALERRELSDGCDALRVAVAWNRKTQSGVRDARRASSVLALHWIERSGARAKRLARPSYHESKYPIT